MQSLNTWTGLNQQAKHVPIFTPIIADNLMPPSAFHLGIDRGIFCLLADWLSRTGLNCITSSSPMSSYDSFYLLYCSGTKQVSLWNQSRVPWLPGNLWRACLANQNPATSLQPPTLSPTCLRLSSFSSLGKRGRDVPWLLSLGMVFYYPSLTRFLRRGILV